MGIFLALTFILLTEILSANRVLAYGEYDDALQHYDSGQYQEAYALALKAAELTPRSAAVFDLLAAIAFKMDDHATATMTFERVVQLRGFDELAGVSNWEMGTAIYVRMALSYAVIGDCKAAKAVLDDGISHHPYDKTVIEWLAVMTYCAEGWGSTERMWRRHYTERELSNLIYHGLYDIAERAEKKGMNYLALRHYSTLFRFSYQKVLGFYSEQENEILQKIIALFRRLPLKPKPPRAAIQHALRAQKHINDKEWQEAVWSYIDVIALAPWWPAAHYNMALTIYAQMGAQPVAVREMEMYFDLKPAGENEQKARKKLKDWKRIIQEEVKRGATFSDKEPFLITPDREDW